MFSRIKYLGDVVGAGVAVLTEQAAAEQAPAEQEAAEQAPTEQEADKLHLCYYIKYFFF